MARDPLAYRRRLTLVEALLTLLEGVATGLPVWTLFDLDPQQRILLWALLPIALATALVIYWLASRTLRGPLDRAVRLRRRGAMIDRATLDAALTASRRLPSRLAWLRAGLGVAVAAACVALLALRAGFPIGSAGMVVVVVTTHGLGAQIFRAVALALVLDNIRRGLSPALDPLVVFTEVHRARLVRAGLATAALALSAIAGFTWLSLPLEREQYLRVEALFPITLAVAAGLWIIATRRLVRPLVRYLDAARPGSGERPDNHAIGAHVAAQKLPYRLALIKLGLCVVAAGLFVLQGTLWFGIEPENALLIAGEALVVTWGAAIYEVLWHRATLRPLLAHIASHHRPPPEAVRTPLSMRTKMMVAFGGLALFACSLSMFWSFVQYKNLGTGLIQSRAKLLLAATTSGLAERARQVGHPLSPDEVVTTLAATAGSERAVFYYLPPSGDAPARAVSTERAAPPPLPWSGEQQMRTRERGELDLARRRLSGAFARLYDERRSDLGALAVLYPGYRGQEGYNVDPQILVLLGFFVVLVAASMGMVILVVRDLTGPIRLLERRAHAMAAGDLSRPVVYAAGEADEVGQLTFAFEEMRRALNDKLRSSTEINLSLEAEVSRRTAELERRNQDLKGALDALQRTQAELLRSEKMASMGRLVAGIAHEINNPVNAVVNSIGPLEATLDELLEAASRPANGIGEVAADLKEMLRVMQSGARRTKEIVQALHNYSRGDDDRLVEVDLHRGIDESLDLLRHHLRHGIQVEKRYGEIARVRGYAGQLHQIFMNLLTNAAQALAEHDRGGVIRITTQQQGDRVVISIADDGPGIAESALPQIFDPFFTTKEVGQGSGLGLSIVHGIVERHGGSIEVESALGQGTTFVVMLPAG